VNYLQILRCITNFDGTTDRGSADRRRGHLVIALLILPIYSSALFTYTNLFSQKTITESVHSIAAESFYLDQPLGKDFHRVSLLGNLDSGKGVLVLDPNTCTLSQFGDPENCTKIAPTTEEVTFKREEVKDTSGNGRLLYRITGCDVLKDLHIVLSTEKTPQALIVNANSGKRVIPLRKPSTHSTK